jgi:hypothetical protein
LSYLGLIYPEHLGALSLPFVLASLREAMRRENGHRLAIHQNVRISMWRRSQDMRRAPVRPIRAIPPRPRPSLGVEVHGVDHRFTFGHLERFRRQLGAYPLMAVAGRLERFLSHDLAVPNELCEQVPTFPVTG